MLPSHKFFTETKAYFEKYLQEQFPRFPAEIPHLEESMRYSLFNPGKRLRPVLLLRTLECLGGKIEAGLPFASAVEYIHCYSLIHDDLPCMDDDALRRGQPTNHKVFGEGMAVLAGDALLTHAFFLCSGYTTFVKPERQLQAINRLAECAGIHGMVGGQVADIEAAAQQNDANLLQFIHEHKTGALIHSCFDIAAILAEVSPEERRTLGDFGTSVGKIFQIQDDILEVVEEQEKFGKSTKSDQKNNRFTYVSLYGVEKSRLLAQEEFEDSAQKLKETLPNLTPLSAMIKTLYPILNETT